MLAGYAGGTTPDPTYRRMGDHTEVVEVTYDPEIISYEELVKTFFELHTPRQAAPRQYRSVILAYDDQQYEAAADILDRIEAEEGERPHTALERLDRFYLAEDYHQKFYLQARSEAAEALDDFYGSRQAWFDTEAAALLNAVAGRELRPSEALERLEDVGWPKLEVGLVRMILERW